ncbi:hypothetical protein HELRODRAFT_158529 [Helobdella robusta]|uniref:Uncharacterized protein n=1 Tax=Helobdella robusta TaxID=6412 RepID=T1EMX2_HELRO|nr:hypothetical protein HELRODRAFT_158529 [Helobdella robusta]ESO12105.1 hypothetical protein HELRODRAFT_158529 [Helobdella robusta]
MHQRYPSNHSTPRKVNRKKVLASSADKIKTSKRRLSIARETETMKTWRDSKRNNAGFKSKDLVLRPRKRQCPAKLLRNWKDRCKRYPAKLPKNWRGRYKITNKLNDVMKRPMIMEKNGQR